MRSASSMAAVEDASFAGSDERRVSSDHDLSPFAGFLDMATAAGACVAGVRESRGLRAYTRALSLRLGDSMSLRDRRGGGFWLACWNRGRSKLVEASPMLVGPSSSSAASSPNSRPHRAQVGAKRARCWSKRARPLSNRAQCFDRNGQHKSLASTEPAVASAKLELASTRADLGSTNKGPLRPDLGSVRPQAWPRCDEDRTRLGRHRHGFHQLRGRSERSTFIAPSADLRPNRAQLWVEASPLSVEPSSSLVDSTSHLAESNPRVAESDQIRPKRVSNVVQTDPQHGRTDPQVEHNPYLAGTDKTIAEMNPILAEPTPNLFTAVRRNHPQARATRPLKRMDPTQTSADPTRSPFAVHPRAIRGRLLDGLVMAWDRCGVDSVPIRGWFGGCRRVQRRFGVDLADSGPIWRRIGTESGSFRGRFGDTLGLLQGRFVVDSGSIWDRCGVDFGMMCLGCAVSSQMHTNARRTPTSGKATETRTLLLPRWSADARCNAAARSATRARTKMCRRLGRPRKE